MDEEVWVAPEYRIVPSCAPSCKKSLNIIITKIRIQYSILIFDIARRTPHMLMYLHVHLQGSHTHLRGLAHTPPSIPHTHNHTSKTSHTHRRTRKHRYCRSQFRVSKMLFASCHRYRPNLPGPHCKGRVPLAVPRRRCHGPN